MEPADIDAEMAAVRRVGAEALEVLERLPTFERLAKFFEDHRDEYSIE